MTTWSRRSIKLVQSWLSTCQSEHRACSSPSLAHRLPLRFLDVDPDNKMAELLSRLDESGNIDLLSFQQMPRVKVCSTACLDLSNTQYLTLSHCWGQSPVAKLSYQNLTQYYQNIPPQVLEPPTAATFRQAILAARCLGFRYLWIDALCINQDDDGEKEEEIAHMSNIYAHATLNLSATSAQDGSGGLFFERDPRIVGACRSEQCPGVVAFAPPEQSFVDEVLRGPTSKRGWVFQERMLATRVLHFCRSRLFWECCALHEAEPVSSGVPAALVAAPSQTRQLVLPRYERGGLVAEKARLRWANIVNIYSRTLLSYHKDTLLALSAIATTHCEQRGLRPQNYAAGLWVLDLPLALRWRVSCRPNRVLDEYVAPSWSWAALFCDVDVQRDAYVREFVDGFDASTTLNAANAPFGRVTGGTLRLRGILRSLRYLESEDCFRMGRSDTQPPTVISSGFSGTVNDGLPEKLYKWSKFGERSRFVEESRQRHDPPLGESNVLICEWDHGIPGHDESPQVIRVALSGQGPLQIRDGSFFLLPLGQRKRELEEDDENEELEEENEADDRRGSFDRIEGLILHRSSVKGEYVRVGIFYYTLRDLCCEKPEEEVLASVFGRDESLEVESYLERQTRGKNGHVTYTIQIV